MDETKTSGEGAGIERATPSEGETAPETVKKEEQASEAEKTKEPEKPEPAETKAAAKEESKGEDESKDQKRDAKPPAIKPSRKQDLAGRVVVHVNASFNNTIVTITDRAGRVKAWSSAGSCGFKGSRKSTPFAAQVTAEKVIREAAERGAEEFEVQIKGPGPGRGSALRVAQGLGLKLVKIADVTPLPHNGCRPPKRRRP